MVSVKTLGFVGTVLGVSLAVWTGPPGSLTQERATAFGYEVGEERRYVLGPPEALRNGESATWTIALESLRGPGADAVFRLRHERSVPVSPNARPNAGVVLTDYVEGELTVNAYGFPTMLRFEVRRQIYAAGTEEYSVRYRLEDGHYLKTVWSRGKEWTITIPIAGHKNLGESVPAGLFLFSTTAIGCMTPGYADPQYDVFFDGGFGRCDNQDPALVNPGLFSLALPMLWEGRRDEHDYLFFTPTGPDLNPGVGGGAGYGFSPGNGMPGTVGRAGPRRRAGGIDNARDRGRYFEPTRVRLRGRTRIELGRRRVDSWRLSTDGPVREIYVDDEGRTLRVSLAPHPVSGEDRWIRLLLPTEY